MSDLSYDSARESNAPGIQRVAEESWRATYHNIFTPEFIAAFLARNYSTEALLRSVRSVQTTFLVARNAERVEGFCHFGVGQSGPELFRLYVRPAFWRTGVGSRLVELMEARWTALGVAEYGCFVHRLNEVGKGFYLKRGFVHEPGRDHEEEWYMRKRLLQ